MMGCSGVVGKQDRSEVLELVWCVQGVHPRAPGVGSREYGGTDAHFYEIWLSLSKVKQMVA